MRFFRATVLVGVCYWLPWAEGASLVLELPLNDPDLAGGPNGVAANAKWYGNVKRIPGKTGQALKFETGTIEIQPGQWPRFHQFTIALWVRIDQWPESGSALVAGVTRGPGHGCYLELYPDGQLSAWQTDPNFETSTDLPADAKWRHLAAVFSGREIILYVDGVERGREPATALPDLAGMPLRISGRSPAGKWHASLNGGVDHVQLFDCALNGQGIRRLSANEPVLGENGSAVRPEFVALTPVSETEHVAEVSFAEEPRPWRTFLPKSPPLARRLRVVDARQLGDDARLALTCLQGLTSRKEPVLWLIFKEPDKRWLEWHRKAGHIDGYVLETDWKELFAEYRAAYRGAVIPDQNLYQGALLACNVAALDDLIVMTPELARELKVPVAADLRGRFKTDAEGLEWFWERSREGLNHHLLSWVHPGTAYNGALGYDIQWRSLMFWITGKGDARQPGADPAAELALMTRIFASLPGNIGVRGFPWESGGGGLGETAGVRFCGDSGKVLIPGEQTANVAIMSGVRIEKLAPPRQAPAPPLRKDAVYVAFTMSDGDNINVFYDDFAGYFEHSRHGQFPVGWGMAPAMLDLMPAVAEWFYRNAGAQDEFFADVSGIGYIFPDSYARRCSDPDLVLDGYLDWTRLYLERCGLQTVRPYRANEGVLKRYAARIPFLHSIFADYGHPKDLTTDTGTFRLENSIPVFRALTSWRVGEGGLSQAIREKVGTKRPAFMNAFVYTWSFTMDDLWNVFESREPEMVFVTPQQLAELYLQAEKRGWIAEP